MRNVIKSMRKNIKSMRKIIKSVREDLKSMREDLKSMREDLKSMRKVFQVNAQGHSPKFESNAKMSFWGLLKTSRIDFKNFAHSL